MNTIASGCDGYQRHQQITIGRLFIKPWMPGEESPQSELMLRCNGPIALFEECCGRVGVVARRALAARLVLN